MFKCLGHTRAGWRCGQVGEPHRAPFLPRALRQLGAHGERQARAPLDEFFCALPWNTPCRPELQAHLLGVHQPLDAQLPSLGDAKRLEDAHARGLARRILAHNLAYGQLQSQPVLALLLLRDVAEQAADRQGMARFLAPAQAQL